MPMPPGQIILYFLGMLAIIFASYYVTLLVGRRAQGQVGGKLRNKNINIVDRFSISRDKSFCLVEIAGKIYVVGITNQTMTLLDTLEAAAFSEAAAIQNTEQKNYVFPAAGFAGGITSGLTVKLANFIASKTGGKMRDNVSGGKAGSFSESMKNAREKTSSVRQDEIVTERTNNPEEL